MQIMLAEKLPRRITKTFLEKRTWLRLTKKGQITPNIILKRDNNMLTSILRFAQIA